MPLRSGRSCLGRVTLRHVSARLSASSVMVGLLAVLLTLAVIGPNACLSYRAIVERQVRIDHPFDVAARHTELTGVPYEEGVAVLEEYAAIEAQCYYTRYDCSEKTESGYARMSYVRESDFRALCALLGYEPPALNGGRLFCTDDSDTGEFIFTPAAGGEEGVVGELTCPQNMLSNQLVIDEWTVLPDAQIAQLDPEDKDLNAPWFAVKLKDEKYDARGMVEELAEHGIRYTVREYERLDEIGEIGLILLGDLFVTGVFILLAVAVLALKSLSLIAEDKPRYRVLWRLGASEGRMQRSLFAQLAFFFLAPFAVALLINLPLTAALQLMGEESVVPLTSLQLYGQLAAISALVFAVFAVYLVAAFFVSWQDIRRNIRGDGRL